jgi:hypothetical protein
MLLGVLLGPGRTRGVAVDQILQVTGLFFGEPADGARLNRFERAKRLGSLGGTGGLLANSLLGYFDPYWGPGRHRGKRRSGWSSP